MAAAQASVSATVTGAMARAWPLAVQGSPAAPRSQLRGAASGGHAARPAGGGAVAGRAWSAGVAGLALRRPAARRGRLFPAWSGPTSGEHHHAGERPRGRRPSGPAFPQPGQRRWPCPGQRGQRHAEAPGNPRLRGTTYKTSAPCTAGTSRAPANANASHASVGSVPGCRRTSRADREDGRSSPRPWPARSPARGRASHVSASASAAAHSSTHVPAT